jgi:hypothetical protein
VVGTAAGRQLVIQSGQQQQQQAVIRPVVAGSQVETNNTAVSSTGDGPPPPTQLPLGSSTILQDLLRKGPEEQGIFAGKLVGLA